MKREAARSGAIAREVRASFETSDKTYRRTRLGTVLRRFNQIIHPGDYSSGQAIFVGLEHVEPGSGRRIGSKTIDLAHLSGRKPKFQQGQIVYGYLRPYLNKVWIAEFDGCSSVDQLAFDVDQTLARTDFLAAFLRSETFLRRASHVTTTGQLPRIGIDEIEAVEIDLPSLIQQEHIARWLGEGIEAATDARHGALDRVAAAQSLPAALLRQVFESPRARSWDRLPIGMLGDGLRGETVQTGPFGAQLPSSEFRSVGIPVLNIGNVKDAGLDLCRLDHVTEQKADELARYRVREGDMLFTRSGSVGRSAVVPAHCDGWLMSYHLLRVAFDRRRVEPAFISAAIRGDIKVLQQVRRAAGRGATRDGINAPILAALTVPVPALQVQTSIISDLSYQLGLAETLIAQCREELADIEALPAALLRSTFNGES